MEGVGEGSSGRCCPNAEEPSKMHSRDATYRIQEGGGRRRLAEVKTQQRQSRRERQLLLMEVRQTGGDRVRMDDRQAERVSLKCSGLRR